MLPPSLRLFVRHQARSVPLQLLRLGSTQTGLNGFAEWKRKKQQIRRAIQPRPHSGNTQGGGSSKKKVKAKTGPELSSSAPGDSSGTKARKRRIFWRKQAKIRKKQPQTPTTNVANGWRPDNWKTDNWGLDSESHVLNLLTTGRTYHNAPT